jgi:branched-chain amino acid transport system substrate-binding protein
VFVKQWHDAQVPIPIGGIDVKSQDADFFTRVGGKANSETVGMFAIRAPLTPKTIPFWDEFVKRYGTAPVYTGIGAYDAVYVYADAVARAKSTEADAVIKELEKTDHVGIAGKMVFDELHDVKTGPGLQNLLFVQWQPNGERVVVWPKESATGKMIAPPWMSN